MELHKKVNTLCSCDTFVVLPPGTGSEGVIFGKNSDRPYDEVQEVVFVPATDINCPSKLKCTYIEIAQVAHTHAVILSKPAWMWGAEMGSNEHGVCIGNEAVWTTLNGPEDSKEKLLGMDLLRLGLERASSAIDAVHVIASLLEEYGQGGNCSDTLTDFTYHNSFLIADPSEAWILETAANLWAAERITRGVRNISNELSIGTNVDLMSPNLKEYAREKGFWDPKETFNFKKCFGLDDDDDESFRYRSGRNLLKKFTLSGNFKETDMFKVLRDKPSGICMSSGSFVSTSSQVSVLYTKESNKPCTHWFTSTPDPSQSVFKPFIFTGEVEFPTQVISPGTETSKENKRSTTVVNRQHELYKLHESFRQGQKKKFEALKPKKLSLETALVEQASTITDDFQKNMLDAKRLFKNSVEAEMKLYA